MHGDLDIDFAGKTFTDLQVFFRDRGEPDFREPHRLAHGRIESRAASSANPRLVFDYLHVTRNSLGHPTLAPLGSRTD